MAIQSEAHTYNEIGTREDLDEAISNITPTDTPFSNMCKKGKADNTFFEWQMDDLAAPGSNAQLEGDVAPAAVFNPTVRAGNRTQISTKTVTVSGTAQATTKAGRGKDEEAYQLVKKAKELKRDVEFALLNNNVYNAGNTTTARTTMGLVGWVDGGVAFGGNGSVISTGTGGNQPLFAANTARTAATANQAAVTEANLLTILQNAYLVGGKPDVLMTDAKTRATVTSWTTSATRYAHTSEKKIINTVGIYESDYGVLKIESNVVLSVDANTKVLYALQSDMWELAYLRPYKTIDLAVTGDFTNKEIVVEYGLKCRNNKAHGAVRDIL
jgi:hypothetical protein